MKKKLNNIRIAIAGAEGKMGQILIKRITKRHDVVLTGALTKNTSLNIGKDVGEIIGIQNTGVSLNNNLNSIIKNLDVLIDFTSPTNTIKNLSICYEYKKMIVIGTTGFNIHEKEKIKNASSKIGIVFSPNFSIGINILLKIIKTITKKIGESSDIDIIEYHHKNKLDSPSGTALFIGETIAKSMNIDFNTHSIHNCNNILNKRKKNDICFSSIRTGNIIGEHKIMFVNKKESIEVKHKSFSRKCFADGALQAAIWLNKQKKGLYDMQDILNSSNK